MVIKSSRMKRGLILIALCGTLAVAQPKSMPYKTVDHPEFVPHSQASCVGDSDRLIGIMDGKQAKHIWQPTWRSTVWCRIGCRPDPSL